MLKEIYVDNFRSLKDVHVPLTPLAFFCGPNGSGKTNLAEAFDFVSNAISNGVAYAVAEKGGFYNICFRRQRRSRAPIRFRFAGETRTYGERLNLEYVVEFSLQTKEESIRSDFYIERENYQFTLKRNSLPFFRMTIQRSGDRYTANSTIEGSEEVLSQFPWLRNVETLFGDFFKANPNELLIPSRFHGFVPFFETERIKVFRISPRYAAAAGTPSISGELGKHGQNLPSALDYVAANDDETFKRLEHWIRHVIPDLQSLRTGYTETKQMGLFMQERGVGSHWYAEDLSDGTLTSIALFLAVLDTRNTTVIIEEPENSLHPWILRSFLQCCAEESTTKQILISTQSPLVVASATPSNLFLVEKEDGRTRIAPAIQRQPMLDRVICEQLLDLGEYWLSGGLNAVPTPPEVPEDDLFGPGDETK